MALDTSFSNKKPTGNALDPETDDFIRYVKTDDIKRVSKLDHITLKFSSSIIGTCIVHNSINCFRYFVENFPELLSEQWEEKLALTVEWNRLEMFELILKLSSVVHVDQNDDLFQRVLKKDRLDMLKVLRDTCSDLLRGMDRLSVSHTESLVIRYDSYDCCSYLLENDLIDLDRGVTPFRILKACLTYNSVSCFELLYPRIKGELTSDVIERILLDFVGNSKILLPVGENYILCTLLNDFSLSFEGVVRSILCSIITQLDTDSIRRFIQNYTYPVTTTKPKRRDL